MNLTSAITVLVSEAVRSEVVLRHPDSDDLAFLYGTIVTDGENAFSDKPTVNLTVFADKEVTTRLLSHGHICRIVAKHFPHFATACFIFSCNYVLSSK